MSPIPSSRLGAGNSPPERIRPTAYAGDLLPDRRHEGIAGHSATRSVASPEQGQLVGADRARAAEVRERRPAWPADRKFLWRYPRHGHACGERARRAKNAQGDRRGQARSGNRRSRVVLTLVSTGVYAEVSIFYLANHQGAADRQCWEHYDPATKARFRPDKPSGAIGKSLIVLYPSLSLNQRVPGSSPGAPTK
jgi:hypothetical protein